MVFFRQEAIGRHEDIKRTGYVKRLNALENDDCNLSVCHQCACPCAKNDPDARTPNCLKPHWQFNTHAWQFSAVQ
ncbi:hypothetical protein PATSB16_05220 [Pandoraea thiooxydans]|nr:hypothetical protein PATSB16_05220 [Pandoraea thiooxydans]